MSRSTSLNVPTRRPTAETKRWWGKTGKLENALHAVVFSGRRPMRVWLPPEVLAQQAGGYESLRRSLRRPGFLSQEIAHIKIGIDTSEAPWFYLWEYGIPGGYRFVPRRRFPRRVFQDKYYARRRGVARMEKGEYRRVKPTPGRHGFRDLQPYDLVIGCLKVILGELQKELLRKPKRFIR